MFTMSRVSQYREFTISRVDCTIFMTFDLAFGTNRKNKSCMFCAHVPPMLRASKEYALDTLEVLRGIKVPSNTDYYGKLMPKTSPLSMCSKSDALLWLWGREAVRVFLSDKWHQNALQIVFGHARRRTKQWPLNAGVLKFRCKAILRDLRQRPLKLVMMPKFFAAFNFIIAAVDEWHIQAPFSCHLIWSFPSLCGVVRRVCHGFCNFTSGTAYATLDLTERTYLIVQTLKEFLHRKYFSGAEHTNFMNQMPLS